MNNFVYKLIPKWNAWKGAKFKIFPSFGRIIPCSEYKHISFYPGDIVIIRNVEYTFEKTWVATPMEATK